MKNLPGLSEQESEMIKAISINLYDSFQHIAKELGPMRMLQFTAAEAFLLDAKGPAVDSLRRCLLAINSCTVYRGTPQYDALIRL